MVVLKNGIRLLLGIAIVFSFTACGGKEAERELTLGFAAVLTAEGIAPFGIDSLRGAELALEDRPTVTIGDTEFRVVLRTRDSSCSPEGGQAVANRFASDKNIIAVVGPTCSDACRSAIPIFDAAGYTSISASCTAANLTQNESASFNRSVPSDAFQGVVAADFIFDNLGYSGIALIDDGSTYGAGLVEVVSRRFEELGGEVLVHYTVTVGDTDFRALMENIASFGPQLIYFGGFNAEAARLIEQRADAGLAETPFMGADGIFGPEMIELAGEAAEGVYASAPIPVNSEELEAFRERYIETYGEEPPSAYHTNAYDAVNMLLDAIEAVGRLDENGNPMIDRAELADYVRSISNLEGLTGMLNCNATGECAASAVGFYVVRNGEYVDFDGDDDGF